MTSSAHPEPHPDIGIELIRDWAAHGEPVAVAVIVHGLGEHSGRYERIGSQLAGAGVMVRGFDLIGAGGSGGPRWDIDSWSRYHDQIERHVSWAGGQGVPVVLLGFSMGGNLCLGYAQNGRPKPDMMVVSAPALGGGAAWQKALAPIVGKLAPKLALPNGFKGEQLSRDPAVGEAYFADPLVYHKTTARLGAALFAAMDEVAAHASEIDIPTLVLHGGSDPIVPAQSTAMLGELPGFDRRLYPNLRHEVLNEPEGAAILEEVIDWIKARI